MQFLFLRALKPYVTLLFTGMLLFTTGCEDDDHDHDHDEDHTDADGFVLETEAGVEVYREFEGTQTGGVTLSVGETLELMVHFLTMKAMRSNTQMMTTMTTTTMGMITMTMEMGL